MTIAVDQIGGIDYELVAKDRLVVLNDVFKKANRQTR